MLAYAVLAKQAGRSDVRVRVDAGGFKRRQADSLGKLAERLAVQVAKSGEPHELQPMTPAERRVIHVALRTHSLVTTESVGEGAGRHLSSNRAPIRWRKTTSRTRVQWFCRSSLSGLGARVCSALLCPEAGDEQNECRRERGQEPALFRAAHATRGLGMGLTVETALRDLALRLRRAGVPSPEVDAREL